MSICKNVFLNINLSKCESIRISIFQKVHLRISVCQNTHLSECPSVWMCINLFQCPSVGMSIFLNLCPSVWTPTVRTSVCLCKHPSVCMLICKNGSLSEHLSNQPSVWTSVHFSECQSVQTSVWTPVHVSDNRVSECPCVQTLVCRNICQSVEISLNICLSVIPSRTLWDPLRYTSLPPRAPSLLSKRLCFRLPWVSKAGSRVND